MSEPLQFQDDLESAVWAGFAAAASQSRAAGVTDAEVADGLLLEWRKRRANVNERYSRWVAGTLTTKVEEPK